MTDKLGIGIVGCGNISAAYFRLAPLFKGLEVRACTDLNMAVAEARAKEFGVRALTMDKLLADDEIDVVINLTIPDAHYAVSSQALDAGNHVYSEKPFVLTIEEGLQLKALADGKGLRVGSAPDTFLGGAHQYARKLIDDGALGTVTAGTAYVMSHGMENWHPNPGLLLPARRRPGARRRPLLRRRPHQPDRPGEARRRAHQHRPPRPAPSAPRARARARRSRSRPRPTSRRFSNSTAARR